MFWLFYPSAWDCIDRTQATDFAFSFHLCLVFLTRWLTCRLTCSVKSAQILETALELKLVFGLGGTVFNLVPYKMCTIEFKWRKACNCLQLKRKFSLVFYLFVFLLSTLQQLPLAIPLSVPFGHNNNRLFADSNEISRLLLKTLYVKVGKMDEWNFLKGNISNTNTGFNWWVYIWALKVNISFHW